MFITRKFPLDDVGRAGNVNSNLSDILQKLRRFFVGKVSNLFSSIRKAARTVHHDPNIISYCIRGNSFISGAPKILRLHMRLNSIPLFVNSVVSVVAHELMIPLWAAAKEMCEDSVGRRDEIPIKTEEISSSAGSWATTSAPWLFVEELSP